MTAPLRPSQALGEQLRRARRERGWRQEDLVARLGEIGASGWRQSKVAKIERGEVKRITLDEALELAIALGVRPARLFSTDAGVAVTDETIVTSEGFRAWLQGRLPPSEGEESEWVYYTCLAPDEVRSEIIGLLRIREEARQRLGEVGRELADAIQMIEEEREAENAEQLHDHLRQLAEEVERRQTRNAKKGDNDGKQ
jgi:transcriptional regulator with XRE-family HTH domain